MKTRIEAANDYIKQMEQQPATTPPLLHFSPPVGWINDPNGFSYYNGEYHLFYQYNPYDIIWNNIHWGHATTTDFITWQHQKIALANDKLYDANGCFSGSAIEKDGKLYLMYTGHQDPNLLHAKDESQIKQVQCIAVSDDGVLFEKLEQNPVIGEAHLPANYLICDFRDPKVWEHEGKYYCVLAVRNKQRRGEILMYVSDDLIDWTFHSPIIQTAYEAHTLLECPDYFQVDGKDVMLYSAMPCDPEYADEVKHRVCYAIGHLDYDKGQFNIEHEGLLDYGHSFYAPQTTAGKDQERLLIGWMQSWNQATPPLGFTFNGMMSLPRELSIVKNDLVQFPATSVLQALTTVDQQQDVKLQVDTALTLSPMTAGHISCTVDLNENKDANIMLTLQDDGHRSIRVVVNAKQHKVEVTSDYSQATQAISYKALSKCLTLDIFIDLYSFELFINKGEQVYTTTSYVDKGQTHTIKANSAITLKHLLQATR